MKHAVKRGALALALATSALATPFSAPGVSANETLPATTVLNLANLQVVKTDTAVPGITRTEYSGAPYKGPWKVNVVVIDPDLAPVNLKGTFGTGLGMGLGTSQTTTSMLDGLTTTNVRKPLVGINGGFFDGNMKNPAEDTWDGDLNGVVIQGGKLLSEAVRGKGGKPVSTSLVLQHGRAYITELSTTLKIKPKGSTNPTEERQLDGINRVPGRASHCEQPDPADTGVPPETQDRDTGVCEDPSEIISFTKEYGTKTPTTAFIVTPNDPDVVTPPDAKRISSDEGFEVVLDSANNVTACFDSKLPVTGSGCTEVANRGGNQVSNGGRILQGIGEGADWLRARTRRGSGFDFPEEVVDTRFNTRLSLDSSMYVTAGGDLLVRNGHIEYTDPAGSIDNRPRTAVGTDHLGRTVLVTVDGIDDPNNVVSIGATRGELATLMHDLNVLDAVNMDGGGSTTLVWEQKLVNIPTDGNARERAVGDTVYAGPGGYPMA
ncbi:phosphodiester glycosidase family protein [Streptomyces sp. NBC_01351]|uniref:phosphodiester glycosidase family protein n=1 Tax=Streptomyces sp. NBC_01351 TaxID=2903833 RepID=UPI002E2FA6F6|nr:phosphodiester glycosidase family protein [Streptomyces sp. NBC_01351]